MLLTAYADTEAAIAAINEVALDYYLLKPWDPPEEQLFPVVEDLLTTWEAGAALEAGGVRVIGHRFSKESHDLRDFLVRNRVPARWLDVERDGEARELLQVAGVDAERLPVALLEDGAVLERPTILELAERLGVAGAPAQDHYDLVVVGGGPAGLAAAVYGASEGLKTVMVEREAPGGQAGQSSRIENYLGFPAGLSGSDLARRATDQARRLGAELLTVQEAVGAARRGLRAARELSGGGALSASCVLVASGVSYRQLDTPGLPRADRRRRLLRRGDDRGARLRATSTIVVIGGANSAGQAAVYFSGYAAQVTMLVRGDSLEKSMSHYLIEQIAALGNVEVRTRQHRDRRRGRGRPPQAPARRRARRRGDARGRRRASSSSAPPRAPTGSTASSRATSAASSSPGATRRPPAGRSQREPYVLETTVPGVFVAGDVRARSIKRVASAVGEGSMAVSLIHEYLSRASVVSEQTSPAAAPQSAAARAAARRRASRHARRAARDRPVRRARRRGARAWIAARAHATSCRPAR